MGRAHSGQWRLAAMRHLVGLDSGWPAAGICEGDEIGIRGYDRKPRGRCLFPDLIIRSGRGHIQVEDVRGAREESLQTRDKLARGLHRTEASTRFALPSSLGRYVPNRYSKVAYAGLP